MWNASLIVLVGISQKKILTLLYTQSVILGEKIYKKRYISLKKKIYINQNITQSLESLMSQLFHDWFKSSFTSLSIKLDFILKIKFHMCSEYKHSSFHSNFKHKNIFFSVLSREWSTVTKRLSALAFRCSSESHVTSST